MIDKQKRKMLLGKTYSANHFYGFRGDHNCDQKPAMKAVQCDKSKAVPLALVC